MVDYWMPGLEFGGGRRAGGADRAGEGADGETGKSAWIPSLLPPAGEGAPEGRMRGLLKLWPWFGPWVLDSHGCFIQMISICPHPNPSPARGRGAEAANERGHGKCLAPQLRSFPIKTRASGRLTFAALSPHPAFQPDKPHPQSAPRHCHTYKPGTPSKFKQSIKTKLISPN
ncbi:hypothetical protein D3C81_1345370 [compost metagenome]